jgi:PAS domain S-box-containing protein
MARTTENKITPDDLRKKAEEKLRSKLFSLDNVSDSDLRNVFHELQVHQIELEMQNEELRASQEALEESRSKYADLYDFAPVGYFTLDKKGLILNANLTGAYQLDIDRNQIIKKPFAQFIHKDDQDVFYLHRREVMKSSIRRLCEIRLRRKNNTEFHAQLVSVAVKDSEDDLNLMRIAMIDITQRKNIEEELRIKQHLNEILIDSIPHSAMLIRKDRKIIAANKIAREVGAIVGGYCWQEFGKCQFVPEEDKKSIKYGKVPDRGTRCYFCNADEALESKGPVNIEVNAWDRLWDTYWVPLDEETYLHYAIDITERKQAEETLKKTAKELARSNSDLEKFAYIASHDLKSPLIAISGFAGMLKNNYEDKLDKSAHKYIDFIVDSIARMENLIHDLLAFSRIGVSSSKLKLVDVNKIFFRAIANLTVIIERNEAKVTHDSLPTVFGNDIHLEQLLQNLIENAIKYHNQKPSKVHISAEQKDDHWIFSIKDNGIGIASENREIIFDMFHCLNRGTYKGTGIGLATCKKIVELYGGKIWVESKLNTGSIFYFTMPITSAV